MTKLHFIGAPALAMAALRAASDAVSEAPCPACAVQGAAKGDTPGAACAAFARQLAAAHSGPDAAGLRLVLTRATAARVSGHVARADGTGRGPDVSTDAQDGALTAADLDHFAQQALALFSSADFPRRP